MADSRSANCSAMTTERCLPPGAADRERQVALALAAITGPDDLEDGRVPVEEVGGVLLGQDVVAHLVVAPVSSRSSGIQYGLGRNRTSTTRSASTGRPYL